ncbi:unnamed protein product [Rotaria magnacalcarata]|uniref:Uncharacterized protein n=1 Tax=Rotaria magnacalcarata TaxID=392030 RepID=A0A816RES7_9BILA|nr:unnamed protein product [Rotaria magnacalcarata]
MSKSNYSYHSSSHRSPSHQPHRLHSHDTIYSPDPYCVHSAVSDGRKILLGYQVKQLQQYSSTKTTNKSNQKGQSYEKYSTFHVHSSDYEMVFVNNETSTNTINKLSNHVNICKQYSIDTESERANNQLSLIQINSIPIKSPSLVALFKAGNKIYSWGNMQIELEPAKELLVSPIPAMLLDIQPHFST